MPEVDDIARRAATLVATLCRQGKWVTTAESCTGGWIAKALTDVPGSSGCLGYGIVSYSNAAKEALLGVRPQTLSHDGAVSEACVRQMAEGVLRLSGADFSVAVSGIAGPDGGSDDKPVGTVWFGWSRRTSSGMVTDTDCRHFDDDREAVRRASVVHALTGLLEQVEA